MGEHKKASMALKFVWWGVRKYFENTVDSPGDQVAKVICDVDSSRFIL